MLTHREDCKNVAWSHESQFLLQDSWGRVRIWGKQHERMALVCLVLVVQAPGGGIMVNGTLSWHNLSPFIPELLLTMFIPI